VLSVSEKITLQIKIRKTRKNEWSSLNIVLGAENIPSIRRRSDRGLSVNGKPPVSKTGTPRSSRGRPDPV